MRKDQVRRMDEGARGEDALAPDSKFCCACFSAQDEEGEVEPGYAESTRLMVLKYAALRWRVCFWCRGDPV